MIAIVACRGGPDATGAASPLPPPEPGGGNATSAPVDPGSESPAATGEPEATASVEPTEPEPTGSSDPGASDDPDATEAPTEGAAAACAGTDENRDFFASVAAAVSWTVYCPVLGDGWFVDAGQYRLAGGGWLEIAYRGPEGARIELREGFTCDGEDCIPAGAVVEDVAFGDMTGTLLALDGGRYAVVVGEGLDDAPQWTLTTSGLAGADVRTIAGDLAAVGG